MDTPQATISGRAKLCETAGGKAALRMLALLLLLQGPQTNAGSEEKQIVRFAIVGLAHDHAGGFIPRAQGRHDILLAGIVESKGDLIDRYAKRFHLSSDLFFPSLGELLRHTNIQAVAIFTSTFDHRRIVQDCARLGIHVVMMEKPLAVNLEHAHAMEAAVHKGQIQLIVNYETTWYPGNQAAYNLVHQGALGEIRKIVVHDGHRGPKEIGCSSDFLEWLTDPVLNGGGALTDFGCYGADLITWLMEGQRPTSVLAVTGHFKPEVYPKVEDEATIVLTYPKAQGIIQASWNWPFDRKDIEIYGRQAYVLVPRPDLLRVRRPNTEETESSPPPLPSPMHDPLSYLGAVVRHEIEPSGLSSFNLNLVVTQILDAARQSARTGKRVTLK